MTEEQFKNAISQANFISLQNLLTTSKGTTEFFTHSVIKGNVLTDCSYKTSYCSITDTPLFTINGISPIALSLGSYVSTYQMEVNAYRDLINEISTNSDYYPQIKNTWTRTKQCANPVWLALCSMKKHPFSIEFPSPSESYCLKGEFLDFGDYLFVKLDKAIPVPGRYGVELGHSTPCFDSESKCFRLLSISDEQSENEVFKVKMSADGFQQFLTEMLDLRKRQYGIKPIISTEILSTALKGPYKNYVRVALSSIFNHKIE